MFQFEMQMQFEHAGPVGPLPPFRLPVMSLAHSTSPLTLHFYRTSHRGRDTRRVFWWLLLSPLKSSKLGVVIESDHKELPNWWIEGLDNSKYLTSPMYDLEVNKFKVACRQSIEEWEAAGWINHDHDVRGWFQWYIRFFQGRRCNDDER